ncbi:MAG TPA: potassium-transporting ATPase subunit C [Terracidiphilus sp.]|jgi:K+-transporting ATPase ATPase C chain
MIKELGPGLRLMIALTILTGLLYPAAMTGISEVLMPQKAGGSLVTLNGKVVGSSLIGQSFSKPEYFHPRPSGAGSGYDATASGGSNLGPTSAKLLHGTTKTDDKGKEIVDFDGLEDRIVHYCVDNEIPFTSSTSLDHFKDSQGNLDDVKLIKAFNDSKTPLAFTPGKAIPSDAVTGSASGLDPHISPANADLQVERIAKARNASPDAVRSLIAQVTDKPALGFVGEPRVNVLLLNLSLDQKFPVRK